MSNASSRALAVIGALVLSLPLSFADTRADALRDKILDSKYSIGDYAVYLGWHDPADWQFDEHASYALPIGAKVRIQWLGWLRVEADASYYRRSKDSNLRVSVFRGPEFDSFSVRANVQWVPLQTGPARPYLGGGPMFVSIGNDFVAFRPDVYEVAPGNPDQFVLASWGEFDLGWYLVGGVDFPVSRRVFPFLEFRAQFGELTFGAKDVHVGALTLEAIGLDVSDLEAVPEDPAAGGRPYEGRYDWSGPSINAGLKIRF